MISNFQLTLYLSKCTAYQFAYPINSNEQSFVLQTELGLTDKELLEFKPNFEHLNMYHKKKFLKTLNEADFAMVSEEHQCREVVLEKGYQYLSFRNQMTMLYRDSLITLEYPHQVPAPFRDLLTTVILNNYAVNKLNSRIWCNLDADTFSIAMNPSYWDKAWLSLLTYFAKYGEFMWEVSDTSYNKQFSLDQTIHAILESWSGQVGYYTALGLWLWANDTTTAIHGYYEPFNGIYSAMDNYTTLYEPNKLLEFSKQYNLGLRRVSRLYLNNHRERCEAVGLSIPSWYDRGYENDHHLIESPEWNDYMGYDGEGYDDEESDPDDWDFEEAW